MECEIERLRNELSMLKVGDQATTDSLRQLLCGTRKELDEERIVSRNLKKEIDRLCTRIEELQVSIYGACYTSLIDFFLNSCLSFFRFLGKYG